jgi:hypothetical protein
MYTVVVSASGRADDKALLWLKAVEVEGAKVEDFKDAGKRFARLDRKLSVALIKLGSGELSRRMHLASTEALKENRLIRGRELLFIICSYFATGAQAELMFSLNDLQKVTLKGDAIEVFQSTWVNVLSGLKKIPDEEILNYLYYEQVKKVKGLSEDAAHYDRQVEG